MRSRRSTVFVFGLSAVFGWSAPARADVGRATLVLLAASRGESASSVMAGDEALAILSSALGLGPFTVRMSVTTAGAEVNGASDFPAISGNGRWVAFESEAPDLVPGDANGETDVFVHDRWTGETIRVSVASDGSEADSYSSGAAISGDGRLIAFRSNASNLVEGDENGADDVFVHDMETGATVRASTASDGTEGDLDSTGPAISADGRWVAFTSSATNLVPGGANGLLDVYVHDLQTGATERASVGLGGAEPNGPSYFPSLSADGRFVAFASIATNLAPGEANDWPDVFVRNRREGTTVLASIGAWGDPGNGSSDTPKISGDGRKVAFVSWATNLTAGDANAFNEVYVRDLDAGTTVLASARSDGERADAACWTPAISADGRWVAFSTTATNLALDDNAPASDVFLRDLETGATRLASVSTDRAPGDGPSRFPALSADGAATALSSRAGTLVSDDANGAWDVFVRDRDAPLR